jgi:hypothetical protein
MKFGKCWLPFCTEFFVSHFAVLAYFQSRRCYTVKLRLQSRLFIHTTTNATTKIQAWDEGVLESITKKIFGYKRVREVTFSLREIT